MFAAHAALILGLVFIGVILLTLFLFSVSPGWWLSQADEDPRLTLGEWLDRAAQENSDAE